MTHLLQQRRNGANCAACGDRASKVMGIKYYCTECYEELVHGTIPHVRARIFTAGRGVFIDDISPSQENAIREMEDYQ